MNETMMTFQQILENAKKARRSKEVDPKVKAFFKELKARIEENKSEKEI